MKKVTKETSKWFYKCSMCNELTPLVRITFFKRKKICTNCFKRFDRNGNKKVSTIS